MQGFYVKYFILMQFFYYLLLYIEILRYFCTYKNF